jgi:hypothetical protein
MDLIPFRNNRQTPPPRRLRLLRVALGNVVGDGDRRHLCHRDGLPALGAERPQSLLNRREAARLLLAARLAGDPADAS